MNTNNNRIVNKNINVNAFNEFKKDIFNNESLLNEFIEYDLKNESFNEFIKNEEETVLIKTVEQNRRELFFSLIPDIQKSYVEWIIKNKFKKDVNAFIDNRSQFLKFYTRKLCDFANDDVCRMGASKKDIRSFNKRKKEALLYSSQLLGLVGNGGTNYLNNSLVDYYVNEQKEQENFLENFRLINSSGKITKLLSNEKKKQKQLAQTLNISAAMAQMAKDNNYEYCLVTLTLPGSYHPAPANKRSLDGFNGAKPLQAQRQIQKFWEDIRANLAIQGLHSGKQYFGAICCESHLDSTLHKHCLIYSSKKDQIKIHKVINAVSQRWATRLKEPLNFDIKEYDEKRGGNGATYIFKYITKTAGSYLEKDNVIIKNMALRSFYSARAFEFFGIKKVVAKFNFLLENYQDYKALFSSDIQDMFEKFDYYRFIKKYERFFKVIRDDKKKIKFISFDLEGNNEFIKKSNLNKNYVLIEKKIYSIFETSENFREKIKDKNIIDDIKQLNKDCEDNVFAFRAYEDVMIKQEKYNIDIEDIVKLNLKEGINTITKNSNLFKIITVVQSLSSKSKNGKPKDKEKPKIIEKHNLI